MELCELLLNLQKYDNAIASQAADYNRLLARVAEIDAAVGRDRDAISSLEARVKENTLATAESEKEVGFIESQIEKLSARFLLIKNEKELAKYNAEMEKLKNDKNRAEEVELGRMDESEKLASEIAARKAEADLKKKKFETELADLNEKIANQKSELDKLNESRRVFSGGIPADALAAYDRLHKAKNGRAVAEVSRKICSGCHLTVPDNTLARARSRAVIVFCPNCQRIMFVEM